ncbi:hypothetical protein CONLIGDRAFT_700101 [Coniochaeta ligniaria NRRL 30616]|uniref:Uncharacterized protein n=1 Tax=Coniochaeta ligniaria NRRL 30616 TaxID=1408157 RepID=A0A1J7ISF4_9PEZI|nr:hypothetical protein CONLIGDRAFT_700101 [Coniochaeta ligniaria NRRL 30616]
MSDWSCQASKEANSLVNPSRPNGVAVWQSQAFADAHYVNSLMCVSQLISCTLTEIWASQESLADQGPDSRAIPAIHPAIEPKPGLFYPSRAVSVLWRAYSVIAQTATNLQMARCRTRDSAMTTDADSGLNWCSVTNRNQPARHSQTLKLDLSSSTLVFHSIPGTLFGSSLVQKGGSMWLFI